MGLIATQPYIKVQREVNRIEQKDIEHERMIYLYDDKIVTQHREFSIQDVFDLSYKKIGAEGGFLYIHTSKGVFSYVVKTLPQPFIEAFKEHTNPPN